MLTEVCKYLRNWFDRNQPKYYGDFIIHDGVIAYQDGSGIPLQQGQYYLVTGSLFNDGVHKHGDESDALTNEEPFDGAVWAMAVPPAVVQLAQEIAAWQEKYGGVSSPNMSPFSSESFGGYSYSKAQGFASTGGGMLTSWESVYAQRLAPWRKI